MSTTQLTTADDLLSISAEAHHNGQRCELVEGELIMMSPGGWRHGGVIGSIHVLVGGFIHEHDLGDLFGAETGFTIGRDPDTVLAPDFAFIAKANLPLEEPSEAYWPGAPDFAIEVLSPSDTNKKINEKIQAWLAAGVKLLWVVDSDPKTVTVYNASGDVTACAVGDVIDSIDLLPGFSLEVAQIFG